MLVIDVVDLERMVSSDVMLCWHALLDTFTGSTSSLLLCRRFLYLCLLLCSDDEQSCRQSDGEEGETIIPIYFRSISFTVSESCT